MNNILIRRMVLSTSLMVLFACLSAQSKLPSRAIMELNPSQSKFELTSQNSDGFTFIQEISAITGEIVSTKAGEFIRLNVPGFVFNAHAIGLPELPAHNQLIEIPYQAEWQIEIIRAEYEVITLSQLNWPYPLFPVQPSLGKHEDALTKDFEINHDLYELNDFFSEEIVSIEKLGILRGVQLGRISINPISYNPVQHELKVISSLEVKVTYINANHAVTSSEKRKFFSPAFQKTFNQVLNYQSSHKELITIAPLNYVIVADRMFETALQEFILWKTQKGFRVQVAYTDEPNVGTTTGSIHNFLSDLYNNSTPANPAPSFVLLVGDIQQVPAYSGTTGSHVSDLYYFCYDGASDYFPDIYYGRFSANTVGQLEPQIEKTIEYEKYLMPDPSFLGDVLLVSGVDASYAPTHGNGQINYGTANYFNANNGLSSYTYLYPASASSATAIRQNVSDGVGFANYTAHCGSNGWGDPSFTTNHVPALANVSKYPLMVGNCCQSAKFDENECFAEAVLRANKKGALGYIGGSNNTYWNEDFWFAVGFGNVTANPSYAQTGLGFYDRLFHTSGEAESEWYVTNGQIYQAGNLAVTAGTGNLVKYYWEIYHLMGDPSITIYQGVPPALIANYGTGLPLGSTQLSVVSEEHAYIALSKDSVLITAAMAGSGGIAMLSFPALSSIGDYQLVITKQNRQPHFGTIQVFPSNTPFVVCNTLEINDEAGNNNGFADYSESIKLSAHLQNLGMIDAQSINISLSSADTCLTIIQANATLNQLLSQENISIEDAFEIQIGSFINDGHSVLFELNIEDNLGNTWLSFANLILYSPKFVFESIQINDTLGNNNGRLEPGEMAYLNFVVKNIGHASYPQAIASVVSSNPNIELLAMDGEINNLTLNTPLTLQALIQVCPTVASNELANLELVLDAGFYSITSQKQVSLNQIIEDWESNDFENFEWNNSSTLPWIIENSNYFDGELAARSGSIGHNQSTVLSVVIDVAQNDSVSFYYFVSCEEQGWSYYDYLEFHIDNVSQGKWAGEIDWTRAAFPITQGTHTLKWTYRKDSYLSTGLDLAMIDHIVFPPLSFLGVNNPPFIETIPDTIVVVNQLYEYELLAQDIDMDELELAASLLPEFLTFSIESSNSALLSGSPGFDDIGIHQVIVYAYDGLAFATQYYTIQVVDQNLINETDQAAFFTYPNPAIDFLHLSFHQSMSENSFQIRIFNLLGEEVQSVSYNNAAGKSDTSFKLAVDHLQSGVYFIELIQDAKSYQQKFIKW